MTKLFEYTKKCHGNFIHIKDKVFFFNIYIYKALPVIQALWLVPLCDHGFKYQLPFGQLEVKQINEITI